MKLKTIEVRQGRYAKVVDRLRVFKENNPNHEITTSYDIHGERVIFKANVRASKESPWFTGHACGSFDGKKTFEKTETIAVGRALAFAGYYADGEIASVEEVEDLYSTMEYQDAKYRLEGVIEDCDRLLGDHVEVEKVRNVLDQLSPTRMNDAARYLRGILDEKRKLDGNLKMAEINQMTEEYVNAADETYQSKMNSDAE